MLTGRRSSTYAGRTGSGSPRRHSEVPPCEAAAPPGACAAGPAEQRRPPAPAGAAQAAAAHPRRAHGLCLLPPPVRHPAQSRLLHLLQRLLPHRQQPPQSRSEPCAAAHTRRCLRPAGTPAGARRPSSASCPPAPRCASPPRPTRASRSLPAVGLAQAARSRCERRLRGILLRRLLLWMTLSDAFHHCAARRFVRRLG